ncbi:rhomboid-like protein [Streptomyces sp. SID3343]|uniref:rhomboid-like protein n=1 Tax=Streptomyces sp. SID3343 TaxID=2690260 RepID=UPI00136E1F87|nr:rhomboid-like protein [Streptomyces sp. SID3343]MYW00072.1 hypothetical protein [Streptomyces sp. SID3343]
MPTLQPALRAFRGTCAWVVSAPGTYLWLSVVYVTTSDLYVRLTTDERVDFLRRRSTNLHNLHAAPLRVLVASAGWSDGWHLVKFTLLFTVLCAVAERWLGTWRWLAVAVLGHVGATCVSQATVAWRIGTGALPESARFVVDVGPSYGYMAVAGLLFHGIARPWRWLYLPLVGLYLGLPMCAHWDFTSTGHLTAVAIGLSCHRLTRGRPLWDPGDRWRRARAWARATGTVEDARPGGVAAGASGIREEPGGSSNGR